MLDLYMGYDMLTASSFCSVLDCARLQCDIVKIFETGSHIQNSAPKSNATFDSVCCCLQNFLFFRYLCQCLNCHIASKSEKMCLEVSNNISVDFNCILLDVISPSTYTAH